MKMKQQADIQAIRKAVQSRHGGFETASDQEIMELWRHLDTDVQASYLQAPETANKTQQVKKERSDNAGSL
jgi:hypothetical protein